MHSVDTVRIVFRVKVISGTLVEFKWLFYYGFILSDFLPQNIHNIYGNLEYLMSVKNFGTLLAAK